MLVTLPRRNDFTTTLLSALFVLALGACGASAETQERRGQSPGEGMTAGLSPLAPPNPESGSQEGLERECDELMIDTLEDASGWICETNGRTGAWYAYNDGSGEQWPAPTAPGQAIESVELSEPRGESRRAMRTLGGPFEDWGGGIGVDLNYDGQTYGTHDVTPYDGLRLWVRGTVDSFVYVRLSTPRTTRTEYGGACSQEPCPNPVQYELKVPGEWTLRSLPFDGFGHPQGSPNPEWPNGWEPFEPARVVNIQFYKPRSNDEFDLWIDDLTFYRD